MSITSARPAPSSKCARALPVAQQRFLFAAQDPNLDTGQRLRATREFQAVGRVAHCARRHDFNARGAELARKHHHALQRFQRAVDRCLAQRATSIEAFAKPRHGLHFVEHADLTRLRHVGDDLADRVGADVDRRDALVAGRGVAKRGRERTGSHPNKLRPAIDIDRSRTNS
jgi:hypothetical protein